VGEWAAILADQVDTIIVAQVLDLNPPGTGLALTVGGCAGGLLEVDSASAERNTVFVKGNLLTTPFFEMYVACGGPGKLSLALRTDEREPASSPLLHVASIVAG